MTLALVLAAGLALAVVFFVARPFLREPAPASDVLDEPSELERRRLELVEEQLAAEIVCDLTHRSIVPEVGADASSSWRSEIVRSQR